MYVYLLFLFFVYFALSPRHTTTRNTTWCERRGSHVGSLFFSIFLSHYVYHYMYTYYIALSFYLSLVSLLSNVNFFLPTSSCFPLSLSLSLSPHPCPPSNISHLVSETAESSTSTFFFFFFHLPNTDKHRRVQFRTLLFK